MGTWGVKLYQNDVACDVRDEYKEALKKGISNEEITEKLIDEYTGDLDDEPIFWFALADTQWEYGRLLEEVKKNTIRYIDSEIDLEKWKEDSKLLEKRKKVLLELKEKIRSPQPKENKIKEYEKQYKCEWNLGDVFSYPLKSEEAKRVGLEGQYLILIKTGEIQWHSEHIIPVVKIKVTKDGKIPQTIEEINNLEYVQTGVYTYYGDGPVTLTAFKFPKDENGLTPYYNIGIITTSKRVIPKKLQYIGNFEKTIIPPKINLPIKVMGKGVVFSLYEIISWKELEHSSIEFYELYNLKQLDLYQPDYWEKQGIDREEKDKRIEEYFKKKGLL